MNAQRRKDIRSKIEQLDKLEQEFEALLSLVDALHEDITDICESEQEYYDNMPEGIQSGEKGETAQTAISALEEATTKLSELRESIDCFGDVRDYLEEAAGA